MTIVAGFCGFGGTILCADSLETVDNYSKRKVRKILDLEVGGPPFNVAIAGAGNDGSYIDSLTEEMTESLYRLDEASLDLSAMVDAISSTVHTFYERHIWPLGSQDSMVEFLIVIQEPKSEGYLFHVHGTTVNRIQDRKTIGIGSMFADVVLAHISILNSSYKPSDVHHHLCLCRFERDKDALECHTLWVRDKISHFSSRSMVL